MKLKLTIFLACFLLIIIFTALINILLTPNNFPTNSVFTVEKGIGLNLLSVELADQKIIKSPFWFKVFSVLTGGSKGIKSGDYTLTGNENVIGLAYRFSAGEFNLTPIKITLPEGLNVFEMAKLLSVKFSKVFEKEFVTIAQKNEGYLFPDTYLFLPNVLSADIDKELRETFKIKIKTLNPEIIAFKKPLADVIKMASIVEEEARTTETRQIVAGILWHRLALNMPLQVDSSFKYINGKTTSTLTTDDLKIDSPYNSYLYKGLPPTPICNPGLDSIRATVTPKATNYLFFLSDKKGEMHYARTYAEHLKNKELYLK